ncbi:MAG: ATP phosphoribosyltransferase [Chloroflexi bacterium]|nr:ATP phosphoribosyltransferase [Chloroflexota bacterium]MQC27967.1 ATP phosphoribosyltransferase [Chloroflexota bacterium]
MSAGDAPPVRVALPRGDLRTPLAERLAAVGFVAEGYGEGSRTYRFDVNGRPGVVVRVFSDADIPIQVALGQYDLGIASRTWIDELLVRYRHESIVPLRPLDLGGERLQVAGTPGARLDALAAAGTVRVATEYSNLAQHYLNHLRVPEYRLYEVWAQAEAWPPDDADLAIATDTAIAAEGLEPLGQVHAGGVWLIGNREALARRDLSAALEPLLALPRGSLESGIVQPEALARVPRSRVQRVMPPRETFRIAVPDGHAQRHTVAALAAAGIAFDGYGEGQALRRPTSTIEGVEVKTIRPQDMPRAVALGRFDLALTGRDWLAAQLATFPSAPVVELCDLVRSKYRLGAVVSEDLPVETIEEAVAYWRRDDPQRPIRLVSEYAALADDYARDRHLGRYRVIPISGASEGFVPEDAEILIEGTETGDTLRANRLRMIDVIMESTNCAIGAPERPPGRRGTLRDEFVERLRAAGARDDA